MTDQTNFTISWGRTANSKNLLQIGFRYSKDGQPGNGGSQPWRCVKKDDACKGRLWTKGNNLLVTPPPHNHDANYTDAETK